MFSEIGQPPPIVGNLAVIYFPVIDICIHQETNPFTAVPIWRFGDCGKLNTEPCRYFRTSVTSFVSDLAIKSQNRYYVLEVQYRQPTC